MDSAVISGEVEERGYERRRAFRQSLTCKGLLYRDDGRAAPQRITMADVSMLGAGFDSDHPVETGTRCRVQLELGPTRISWRLRVRFCGKVAEGPYRIGCEFIPVEPPLFDLTDGDLEREAAEPMLVLQ